MCVDNEESRSRLFRSSCSRRSLEIASGHYGRLLTASPPTVPARNSLFLFYLAFSPRSSSRLAFLSSNTAPDLAYLFQPPTSFLFLLPFFFLLLVQARSSCGMRYTPVASTSSWSPLTSTCTDPPRRTGYTLFPRNTRNEQRSPTHRGIERAR